MDKRIKVNEKFYPLSIFIYEHIMPKYYEYFPISVLFYNNDITPCYSSASILDILSAVKAFKT